MHEESTASAGGDTDTRAGEGLYPSAFTCLRCIRNLRCSGQHQASLSLAACAYKGTEHHWLGEFCQTNAMKDTSKENVVFPLSLVALGTIRDGDHPWGVRMRGEQQRKVLRSSERCAKARQQERNPLGLYTTMETCSLTWKNM